MEGVVKDELLVFVDEARRFPPDAASYQLKSPLADDEAASVTVPVPHTEPGTPVGAEGIVLTVATTELLVALVHVPLSNST